MTGDADPDALPVGPGGAAGPAGVDVSDPGDAGDGVRGRAEDRRAGVSALRRARRRRRLGDRDWGELAYRAYTTSLGSLVAVVFLSGLVGDEVLDAAGVDELVRRAPGWAGLLVAVVVLAGVRSGARGGPLALEAPDVAHLLAAPVDRSAVLRRPAAGALGYGALTGAVVGGLAGSLADQRIGDAALPWVASGALFGLVTAVAGLGAALVVGSRTVPRLPALAVGWLLVAWSVAELADVAPASPTHWVGALAVWPGRAAPAALVTLPVVAAVAAVGLWRIGGLSLEWARRRTALVGQLRFAATQQDLRTVVLLRRQLAAERPRSRPWLPHLPRFVARRAPVAARDLASIARWPLVRVGRVLVVASGGALALRAVWSGTTPLVVVAGLAAYVVALDALEPMAQEVDHPGRLGSLPLAEGVVLVRHLAVPAVVATVAGAVGTAVAWAVAPDPTVLVVGAAVIVPAVLCGVAGAAITVMADVPTGSAPDAALVQPEVAGPRLVLRLVWPPTVAVLGTLPLLLVRESVRSGDDTAAAVAAAVPALGAAALLAAAVFVWVRFRADLHRAVAESTGARA